MTLVLNDEAGAYPTVATAEGAIIAAGYRRDSQRHIWINPDTGKTAKVVRTENLQFRIEWA